MMGPALFFLLAFGAVSAADEEMQGGGVAKVVAMLKDMKSQLEKEAEEDGETMDKMRCWCETNSKEKTKANADNTAKIAQLGSFIEESTSGAAQLKVELEELAAAIEDNSREIAEATAIRTKESAEFQDNEKEQIISVKGLSSAVEALGSKIELRQDSFLQVSQALGSLKSHPMLQNLGITEAQAGRVQSFLQTGARTTAPASGEVFGVLKQMKESFETSLKDSQTEEAEAKGSFSDLTSAKETELANSRETSDIKEAQLAETVSRLAEAKSDLGNTKVTLEADTKFLADLEEKCGNMEAEAIERTKVRGEEIMAVGEALGVLNSDEARAQMSKSVGFVQLHQSSTEHKREAALRLMQTAASRLGSKNLARMATRMQGTDVFKTVIEAVDKMIAQLKQEGKDEMEHKDWCVDEFNSNERQTGDANTQTTDLATEAEDLTLHHADLKKEVEADSNEVADMHLEMKGASENREAQNKDFQVTVSDQRATQSILKKALGTLEAFYKKKAALFQQPGGFKPMKKNGASTGVMMMIEGIIKESATIEKQAIAAEQEAQTAYEEFIANSNSSIEALRRGLAEKKEAMSKATADLARTHADEKANMDQLEHLSAYAAELHESCDFVLQHWELRGNMRAQEIDALFEGKAVMSGAR